MEEVMSPLTFDQRQLQNLGQLISSGGYTEVHGMLRASLERLITFWPAEGGALLYHAPHSEVIRIEHGKLDAEGGRMIDEAREAFVRRDEGGEPAIGSFALDDDRQLLELPLQSNQQTVGLLHLVVREGEHDRPAV